MNRFKICKLIFLLIFFNTVSAAYSSGVDIPKEIYSNKELIDLDQTLNDHYYLLIKVLAPQEVSKLKIEQRKWLIARNELGSKPNYIDLTKEFYNERINYLKERFKAAAKPIIDGLITDEEHIVNAEKLKLIENCHLNVCKAYKLYLGNDNEKTISPEVYKANREAISKLAANIFRGEYDSFELEQFNLSVKEGVINRDLLLILISSRHLYNEIENLQDSMQIPLWLVIKHPNIINNLFERHYPDVKAEIITYKLPKFSKLFDLLIDITPITHDGSMYLDVYAHQTNFTNLIRFAPQLDESKLSIKEKLQPFYDWSFEGIWNRKKFNEFNETYDEAIVELREYYKTNYNLNAFADRAEDLIASFVRKYIRKNAQYSQNSAYKLFSQPNLPLKQLKTRSTNFTQEDWNIALSVAILNNYSPEVINWLIKSGADVNSLFVYETPLMKAIEQPEIVKILLDNGANPNVSTPYGKTPLFYAIQYNNLESVKLLLKAKADINAAIKNKESLEGLCHESGAYFLLEKVANFTPLVYALEYSSEKVIDLLIKEGATLGALKVDDIKGWVKGNEKIKEDKLNNILNSLK